MSHLRARVFEPPHDVSESGKRWGGNRNKGSIPLPSCGAVIGLKPNFYLFFKNRKCKLRAHVTWITRRFSLGLPPWLRSDGTDGDGGDEGEARTAGMAALRLLHPPPAAMHEPLHQCITPLAAPALLCWSEWRGLLVLSTLPRARGRERERPRSRMAALVWQLLGILVIKTLDAAIISATSAPYGS